MLTYMLDTNICIYVMKNYPPNLREKFNALAEQLCISSITLGELHYGAEKSARRVENLTADPTFRGAPRRFGVRGQGGCPLRTGSGGTGTYGSALRPSRHADWWSRPQRGADRRNQQYARVQPHAGNQS